MKFFHKRLNKLYYLDYWGCFMKSWNRSINTTFFIYPCIYLLCNDRNPLTRNDGPCLKAYKDGSGYQHFYEDILKDSKYQITLQKFLFFTFSISHIKIFSTEWPKFKEVWKITTFLYNLDVFYKLHSSSRQFNFQHSSYWW